MPIPSCSSHLRGGVALGADQEDVDVVIPKVEGELVLLIVRVQRRCGCPSPSGAQEAQGEREGVDHRQRDHRFRAARDRKQGFQLPGEDLWERPERGGGEAQLMGDFSVSKCLDWLTFSIQKAIAKQLFARLVCSGSLNV